MLYLKMVQFNYSQLVLSSRTTLSQVQRAHPILDRRHHMDIYYFRGRKYQTRLGNQEKCQMSA
jgi:hypothetical protein